MRDVQSVLDRVQSGVEIVVERNSRPVAIMIPAPTAPRTMTEIVAAMEAAGACGTVDIEFAQDMEEDVEDGIAARNLPWNPPSWD